MGGAHVDPAAPLLDADAPLPPGHSLVAQSDPSPLHLDTKGTIWSRTVMRGPSRRFERQAADPSFPMFLFFSF